MDLLINPYLLMKLHDLGEPDKIVTRKEWKAIKPKRSKKIDDKKFPLPYMVITYTNTPACQSKKECKKVVQEIQEKHMAEGAPDIKHNYLISTDGTIYEGSSPKMVTINYRKDDEKLSKANENSINIAIIDDGIEKEPTKELSEEATKLTAKLMREQVVTGDVRLLWLNRNEINTNKQSLSKGTKRNISEKKGKGDPDKTTPEKVRNRRKPNKNAKKLKEAKSDEFNDKVVRGKPKGPFILDPNHIGTLVTVSDQFADREDYDTFF